MDKRVRKDLLLECLVIFTKLYNKPYTAEALITGLPIEDGSNHVELFSIDGSKSLFSRAAKRAGFSSSLVKRDLEKISSLVLPCILMLRSQKACILKNFNEDRTQAKIIYPEIDQAENWIDIDILHKEYLGYCFFLKKEFSQEEHYSHLLQNKSEHWFWSTIKKAKVSI